MRESQESQRGDCNNIITPTLRLLRWAAQAEGEDDRERERKSAAAEPGENMNPQNSRATKPKVSGFNALWFLMYYLYVVIITICLTVIVCNCHCGKGRVSDGGRGRSQEEPGEELASVKRSRRIVLC